MCSEMDGLEEQIDALGCRIDKLELIFPRISERVSDQEDRWEHCCNRMEFDLKRIDRSIGFRNGSLNAMHGRLSCLEDCYHLYSLPDPLAERRCERRCHRVRAMVVSGRRMRLDSESEEEKEEGEGSSGAQGSTVDKELSDYMSDN